MLITDPGHHGLPPSGWTVWGNASRQGYCIIIGIAFSGQADLKAGDSESIDIVVDGIWDPLIGVMNNSHSRLAFFNSLSEIHTPASR